MSLPECVDVEIARRARSTDAPANTCCPRSAAAGHVSRLGPGPSEPVPEGRPRPASCPQLGRKGGQRSLLDLLRHRPPSADDVLGQLGPSSGLTQGTTLCPLCSLGPSQPRLAPQPPPPASPRGQGQWCAYLSSQPGDEGASSQKHPAGAAGLVDGRKGRSGCPRGQVPSPPPLPGPPLGRLWLHPDSPCHPISGHCTRAPGP